jgi:hypothetical protein
MATKTIRTCDNHRHTEADFSFAGDVVAARKRHDQEVDRMLLLKAGDYCTDCVLAILGIKTGIERGRPM